MQKSSILRTASFAVLLGGAAFVIGLWIHNPANTALRAAGLKRTPLHATAPVQSAGPSRTLATARLLSQPALEVAKSAAPSLATPASESIRRVLPSVRDAVADWRLFAPDRLTVEAVAGEPMEFECVDLKAGGPNGELTVWTGRNRDRPGAFFIGVGGADGWQGSITLPGANERLITIRGDKAVVAEQQPLICATSAFSVDSNFVVEATPLTAAALDAPAQTVDIVFFYGDEIPPNNGEPTAQSYVTTFATRVVEGCNVILEQSGVPNLRWRLAGVVKVPFYTKKQTLNDELTMTTSTSDPIGVFMTAKMEEIGADQRVLILQDGSRNGSEQMHYSVAGLAFTPGEASVAFSWLATEGFAHEFAHNFGCRHDRDAEYPQGNDGNYNYGYLINYPDPSLGPWMTGTIMSDMFQRIPYFSNPDIVVSGFVVYFGGRESDYAGYEPMLPRIPLGIAAGQPKAADNARYLREHAQSMAAIRELVTVPVITTQPANASVTTGQTLSLSVTATGGHLNYQWQRSGVDIAGATSATYTKSNVTSADAGSYTVTVRNTLGSTPSTAAIVSVSAPVTPPSSGSSGGGGGGPIAGWFLAVLIALGLLRRQKR